MTATVTETLASVLAGVGMALSVLVLAARAMGRLTADQLPPRDVGLTVAFGLVCLIVATVLPPLADVLSLYLPTDLLEYVLLAALLAGCSALGRLVWLMWPYGGRRG